MTAPRSSGRAIVAAIDAGLMTALGSQTWAVFCAMVRSLPNIRPSRATIAQRSGVPIGSISRNTSRMVKAGLIDRKLRYRPGGGRLPTRYDLADITNGQTVAEIIKRLGGQESLVIFDSTKSKITSDHTLCSPVITDTDHPRSQNPAIESSNTITQGGVGGRACDEEAEPPTEADAQRRADVLEALDEHGVNAREIADSPYVSAEVVHKIARDPSVNGNPKLIVHRLRDEIRRSERAAKQRQTDRARQQRAAAEAAEQRARFEKQQQAAHERQERELAERVAQRRAEAEARQRQTAAEHDRALDVIRELDDTQLTELRDAIGSSGKLKRQREPPTLTELRDGNGDARIKGWRLAITERIEPDMIGEHPCEQNSTAVGGAT